MAIQGQFNLGGNGGYPMGGMANHPGQMGGRQDYPQTAYAAGLSQKKHEEVIFGDVLRHTPPQLPGEAMVNLYGIVGVGENDQKIIQVPISQDILSTHIMLLGGIGTGKTTTFNQIIGQLSCNLSENDIMIIFDTKGDFYKEFCWDGDIVISNDHTARGINGYPDYWNIFSEVAQGEQEYASVLEISKGLFKEACEKTSQVFFPNAARDLFMATMLHLLRRSRALGEPDILNNETLIGFINSATGEDYRNMLENHDDLRAMINYISTDDSPQTQGVLSELQQVVRNYFVGNFAKKGTLGVQSLVKNKGGRKVFIEYDLSYGETLTPIYSLMFDMGIKQALGRERSDGNVYLITDEFRLLPNLVHIDDAVNFGRSLGIKFMIGIQNVEQIFENYGVERAHSILSGFLTSINFRINDPKSREFIKEQFGKNRKKESYSGNVDKKGMIESVREGSVVEDWDIKNLKTGQAIVGFPEYEPFVFQFARWDAIKGYFGYR